MKKLTEHQLFERWAHRNGFQLDRYDSHKTLYVSQETRCAWIGWKSGRAAHRREARRTKGGSE